MRTYKIFWLSLLISILQFFVFEINAQEYRIRGYTTLKDIPKPHGKAIATLSGEIVTVIGKEGRYYLVRHKDKEGYVLDFYLPNVDESKLKQHSSSDIEEDKSKIAKDAESEFNWPILAIIHPNNAGIFADGVRAYRSGHLVNPVGRIMPDDTITVIGYKRPFLITDDSLLVSGKPFMPISSELTASQKQIFASETKKASTPSQSTKSSSQNWYEGGTLHRANISTWKKATYRNKLATCADFAAVVDKSISMSVLKQRAIEIKNCIEEATRGIDGVNNQSVSDIATYCIIILGYERK